MITFEIDGEEYEFTKDSKCSDSLDELSSQFSFQTPRLENIKRDQECLVKVDGKLFITGYIFAIKDSEKSDQYTITVSGHSKSMDVVHSTTKSLSIKGGLSLGDAVDLILKDINSGLKVVDKSKQFFTENESLSTEFGDNAFEVIAQYCRKKQVLLTDNEKGNILLTRGEEKFSGLVIRNTERGNVIQSSAFEDSSGLFSEYHVKSQLNNSLLNLGGDIDPKSATNQDGIVSDRNIRSSRVMRVQAESSSTNEMCEDRAAWMYAMRLSRARGVQYTLSGHSQNGVIYRKGETIKVEDERRGINENWLIKSVEYNQNNEDSETGGNTTIINVVPIGTYRIQASEPAAAKEKEVFSFE